MKRKIPLLIVFITGIVYIAAKFIPQSSFQAMREDFSMWFNIIAAFAFILGGGNLIFRHASSIMKKQRGWGYSVICLLAFFLMLVASLFKIGNPDGWAGNFTDINSLAGYLYNYVYDPLVSSMFALLAFYIASASYRAFRAKNREATILLISALIILLGRTFVGTAMTSWLPESLSFFKIPNLFSWIMTIPNTAGQKALMIGIALGIVSTSLKVILGIESSFIGRDE